MCQIHGLTTGKYLLDESLLRAEDAKDAHCTCQSGDGSTRRQALGKGVLAAGAAAVTGTLLGRTATPSTASAASGPTTGDRLIMLGVNGGPIINPTRAEPALALNVSNPNGGNTVYMIDVGDGASRQLRRASLPTSDLRHVFVTHHHSDHVSGYPALALHGWLGEGTAANGFRRLDMWGPKPVVSMQKHLAQMFKPDIDARSGLGLKPLPTLLHGHQYTLPKRGIRKIMEDRNVIVHAARVNHGTDVVDAYGYRFDLKRSKKSITFSGDTAPTQNLIDLAKDTDILVHEAMYLPGLQVLLDAVDPSIREALRIHNIKTHTDVADIPGIAKKAGAKRLVLCHYVPGFFPTEPYLTTAKQSAASVGYSGEIIAPEDLDSIAI